MTVTEPLRIVSLLPSATEIVAALGLTGFLVGRSHECDYPEEVKDLPVCTAARLDTAAPSAVIDADVRAILRSALSIYELQTEVIEALQPTHIITQDLCDVCAVSFADVREAVGAVISSRPKLVSLQPRRLADVWTDIDRVGEALNIPAEPVLKAIEGRIETVAAKVPSTRPTVLALEWIDPLMGAGGWIPELITIAGGIPVLGEIGGPCPYLQWEEVRQADPDIIVIMPCGFDLERTRQEASVLSDCPDWWELKAVKAGKVFIADGNAYFNRPGPRLVDSLEILAEIVHSGSGHEVSRAPSEPVRFDFGHCGRGWTVYTGENW
jgi:iron complex transport system substrate-binding protein